MEVVTIFQRYYGSLEKWKNHSRTTSHMEIVISFQRLVKAL